MHALRQKMNVSVVLFTVICTCVLAACGTNSVGAGVQPAPTPSPSPTAITVPGYGSAYGCPGDAVVHTAPAAANLIIRPGQGRTFSVQKGEVMEVQMPFGVAWQGPTTSGGVLQLQSPSGYVWKPNNACIWRFVARGSGTVVLTFSGMPLCKKATLCVPAEVFSAFTINVA